MTTTATPTDTVPSADVEDLTGLTVVEGPTAEAALTELHRQLGPAAQVVEVRKVHRGGIGGFFAREVVQIHARGDAAPAPSEAAAPRDPAAADAGRTEAAPVGTSGVGTPSPVDRLLSADAGGVVDFATYLRGQLGGGGAPAMRTATEAPRDDQRDHDARLALLERATAAARAAAAGPTGGGVVDPRTGTVAPTGGGTTATAPTPAAFAPAAEHATDEHATGAHAIAAPATCGPATVAPAAAQPAPDVVEAAPRGDLAASPSREPELTDPTTTVTVGVDPGDRLDLEPLASTEPGPAWSVAALIKLGLPAGLVRELDVAAPHDDVAWTAALAGALRSVCRPLPAGPSLVIGPRARSLATATGVTLTSVHQPIRSRAKVVAAAVGASAAGRSWVERTRGNRWLHLVVGGKDWRSLLHLDPLAVSWAGPEELPETVRLAVELGLVLGSGPLRGTVGRARPLDVALALRDQLPVRR